MQKLFCRATVSAALMVTGMVCGPSAEAQWGTLSGQIVLDGDIPKIDPLVKANDAAARDSAVCAAQAVPDEKLVVDPATKGIANVFVYLAGKPPKIHPDLVKSKDAEISFDQKGCRFTPHALIVRTGESVRVLSGDPIAHNTHIWAIKNKADNFIVPPNDREGVKLDPMKLAEKTPTKISCDIHNWMVAYWLVIDHPYAAVTDEHGKFEIADLPVGDHTFMIWQESSGWLEKKYTVKIKEGDNEQKPIKYTSAQILK